MPTRNGGGGLLPFFSTPGSNGASSRSLLFIPRSCLSPRVFLSCILATFTISWLMLYSYSHLALGFSSTRRDNEDWMFLEQRMGGSSSKTMRWRNSTLTSTFSCNTMTSKIPSIRGTGFDRETICTVQNLCVDAERGWSTSVRLRVSVALSIPPICLLYSFRTSIRRMDPPRKGLRRISLDQCSPS